MEATLWEVLSAQRGVQYIVAGNHLFSAAQFSSNLHYSIAMLMYTNSIATRLQRTSMHTYTSRIIMQVVTKYRHNNKIVPVYVMKLYGAAEL